MYLIDKVNLIAAGGRHVLDVIEEFTHVIDTGPGGRINLYQINASSTGDFCTGSTLITRC
jgi:hypothetical protein